MSNPVRTLLYDLESAPNVSYTWGKWDQNVIAFQQEWYLLSVSWRWLGERQTHVKGLCDYEGYQPGSPDDSALAWLLHDLFDEADVAVTHNGNSFDQPKARARMIYHHIPPPSPFQEVDTLKVARRVFSFTSNSLEDLCKHLGLGFKGKPGFGVWLGCMAGDEAAWRKMLRYNRTDVVLLEELYLRLLPWMDRHPNLALIAEEPTKCPRCLGGPLTKEGFRNYGVTRRQRYKCQSCGAWTQGRAVIKSDVQYT